MTTNEPARPALPVVGPLGAAGSPGPARRPRPGAGAIVPTANERAPSRGPSRPSGAATSAALARSATIVGGAFVVSRLMGLAREVIFASRFGTSGDYSAYVAAFRIPDLLFLVVMAGSFGSAFIPVFAGFLGRGQEDEAWDLASVVLNVAAITILVTAAIAFVLAEPLVRWLVAPGLDPGLQHLTANIMRILLVSPIALGLGIGAKGILEAQDRFTLPALAPLLYNLAIILAALILGPSLGVYGPAIGVAVGAVAHLGLQIPGLIRSGMRYRPLLDLRTPGLRQVGRLLAPRILGQAVFQLNFIVVTSFASHLGDQKIAALNFAWQLMMLPHGVLALGVSTVVFPSMARLFEQGRIEELVGTFARALRPLLFLTVPAGVGLFAFRTAIIQTLLQYGAFSGASTGLVAPALAYFAAGLVFYALVEVLTRTYYAMQDTRTPVIASLVIIAINLALSYALVGPLGHAGLALSLSLTTAIEAVILTAILWRRLGGLIPDALFWLFRVGLATAAMGAVATIVAGPLAAVTRPGVAPRLIQYGLFSLALALAAGTYLAVALFAEIEELPQIAGPVLRRLAPLAGRLSARLGWPGSAR